MSAACCKGRYRHTNKFIIIHFDDGNVSEGFLFSSVHLFKYHVRKVEGSEWNAVKN